MKRKHNRRGDYITACTVWFYFLSLLIHNTDCLVQVAARYICVHKFDRWHDLASCSQNNSDANRKAALWTSCAGNYKYIIIFRTYILNRSAAVTNQQDNGICIRFNWKLITLLLANYFPVNNGTCKCLSLSYILLFLAKLITLLCFLEQKFNDYNCYAIFIMHIMQIHLRLVLFFPTPFTMYCSFCIIPKDWLRFNHFAWLFHY